MSRTALLLAIIPLLFVGGCKSHSPHQNAEEEIIALERGALDKWSKGNTLGYIDISADDATWFDFTPGTQLRIEGREALRKYLAPIGEQIPHHRFEIVKPKIQIYDNTAILTFHWKASTLDGNPIPSWKTTSVYNWNNGKWQMVHAHWSPVQTE